MKPEVNYEKLDRLLAQLRVPEGMPLLSFEPDLEPTPRIALRNNLIAAGAGALCFAVVIGAAAWAFQQQSDSMIDPPASTVTSSSGPPSVSSVVSELEVSSKEEPVSSEEISSSESVPSEETSSEEVPVSSQEESSLPESVAESSDSTIGYVYSDKLVEPMDEVDPLNIPKLIWVYLTPEASDLNKNYDDYFGDIGVTVIRKWHSGGIDSHDRVEILLVLKVEQPNWENFQRIVAALDSRKDTATISFAGLGTY